MHRDRVLPGDVAERAHHGQRPAALHPFPAGNQVQQHPWRQQCQHRDHRAHRTRERQQRVAGHRGQRDDGRAEGAIGHRRIVGDGRDPDGVQVRDAEGDQDGRDHRPRVAEADQALEQRAEGPREQHRLHPHVHAALRDQPAAEILEHAAHRQHVEQHHAPEGDPVNVPHARGGTVGVRVTAIPQGHVPHPHREREGEEGAEQRRQPRRPAEHREHHQQRYHGYQRHQAGQCEVVERIQHLGKHEFSLDVRQAIFVHAAVGAATDRSF